MDKLFLVLISLASINWVLVMYDMNIFSMIPIKLREIVYFIIAIIAIYMLYKNLLKKEEFQTCTMARAHAKCTSEGRTGLALMRCTQQQLANNCR